jgi:hypothetical protein
VAVIRPERRVREPFPRTAVPIDNQSLISCCRHLAARNQPSGGMGERLRRDLTAVGLEFDRVLVDPSTAIAIRAGGQPWPVIAPRLRDLLLTAADSALTTDPSLTGLIADTVLLAQRGSRAAWRLRAQAHEQWGDLSSAVDAHEEYLARTDVDELDIATLVSALREARDGRVALAAALIDAQDEGARLPMPGAADLHDMLSRPVRQETLGPALEDFLAELILLPTPELAAVSHIQQAAMHCLSLHPAGRLGQDGESE